MSEMEDSWWFLEEDLNKARSSGNCECGLNATYKKKPEYLRLKYLHSYWCPEYIDKETYELLYGEQKETRK